MVLDNMFNSVNARLRGLWSQHPAAQITLIATVLAILTFSAFSGALNCSFILLDDPFYVYNNPHVTGGLTWDSVVWAFSATEQGNWHPLTWLSHMLDVELYDLTPKGHHLTSLYIHTLNSLLCFWLFFLLTGHRWRSGLIALFFAIHPLRAESVVWISERKDVLCAFFGFLTLIAYIKYVTKKTPAHYVCVLILLLLGLMSKTMIVTWPFVFLLLDYWPLNRFGNLLNKRQFKKNKTNQTHSLWFLVKEKIPFFALILLFCGIAYWSQSSQNAVRHFQEIPIGLRFENIAVGYVRYLGKIFAPFSLSIFYPITLSRSILWMFLGSLLVLGIITFGVIRFRFKKPYLLVGWFWYLGTLMPVIGLVHIGFQAMADRYTYLPGLGILLILIQLGADIAAKNGFYKTILISTAVLAAGVLMITSWAQTTYWKNGLTIYQHAAEVTDANPIIWLNYGYVLESNGQYDLALEEYQKLMELYPDSPDPWICIGQTYLKMKQPEKAEKYLLEGYQLLEDESPKLLVMLSRTCKEMGKHAEAEEYLTKAIEAADRHGQAALKQQLIEYQQEMQTQH